MDGLAAVWGLLSEEVFCGTRQSQRDEALHETASSDKADFRCGLLHLGPHLCSCFRNHEILYILLPLDIATRAREGASRADTTRLCGVCTLRDLRHYRARCDPCIGPRYPACGDIRRHEKDPVPDGWSSAGLHDGSYGSDHRTGRSSPDIPIQGSNQVSLLRAAWNFRLKANQPSC
jgi:hypothetical protein